MGEPGLNASFGHGDDGRRTTDDRCQMSDDRC